MRIKNICSISKYITGQNKSMFADDIERNHNGSTFCI